MHRANSRLIRVCGLLVTVVALLVPLLFATTPLAEAQGGTDGLLVSQECLGTEIGQDCFETGPTECPGSSVPDGPTCIEYVAKVRDVECPDGSLGSPDGEFGCYLLVDPVTVPECADAQGILIEGLGCEYQEPAILICPVDYMLFDGLAGAICFREEPASTCA